MSLTECRLDGRPGFRWDGQGRCCTYDPGDEDSMDDAIVRAIDQAVEVGTISEEVRSFHLDRAGERRKKRNQRRKTGKQVTFVKSG